MSDHLERLEQYVADTQELNARIAGAPHTPKQWPHGEDILAACAECRQLRADVAALEGLFADLHTDDAAGRFAAGVAHGAARQLGECLRLLGEADLLTPGLPTYGEVLDRARDAMTALGPVRPPLPTERLAAENSELRVAALRLLSALFGVPSDLLGATAELRRLLKLPAA